MKTNETDWSNYIPATNTMRTNARIFDWLVMTCLATFLYFITDKNTILHKIPVLLSMVSLFYLLLYCPLMNTLGGTFGKHALRIEVISVAPFDKNVTIVQSYKRVMASSYIMLAAIILLIFISCGHYDWSYYEADDGSENAWSSTIFVFMILAAAGFLAAQDQSNPETILRKKRSLYGFDSTAINEGQGKNDLISRTAVVYKWKEKEKGVNEYEYETKAHIRNVFKLESNIKEIR